MLTYPALADNPGEPKEEHDPPDVEQTSHLGTTTTTKLNLQTQFSIGQTTVDFFKNQTIQIRNNPDRRYQPTTFQLRRI